MSVSQPVGCLSLLVHAGEISPRTIGAACIKRRMMLGALSLTPVHARTHLARTTRVVCLYYVYS